MNRAAEFAVIAVLAASPALAQEIGFGDVPYEKLATREATEQSMMTKLARQMDVEWGPWYLLSPFPGNDSDGSLVRPLPPEDELPRMAAGGPGPDLTRVYEGKSGLTPKWTELGPDDDRAVDLRVFNDEELNTNAIAFLYRTVTAPASGKFDLAMGSDDGLEFWLNGRLLVQADQPRSMDPEAHHIALDLQKGVNHILCKVSQGNGSWEYLLNRRHELNPFDDAKLQACLNRDFPTPEQPFYTLETIPIPNDIVLEVGGLAALADGRLGVSTRRGDIYFVDYNGTSGGSIFAPIYSRFASGLHEALGLAARTEQGRQVLYAVQRGELTRLVDLDGDDRCDVYEAYCDSWGVSGNYHEFAFGPKFDAEGNAWVSLNVGFCGSLGKSIAPYRGWIGKVTPRGEFIPIADGARSPNGIGILPTGEVFYVDNQGDYVGTNRMSLVAPGLWEGHPSSLRWRDGLAGFAKEPQRQRATIWFPYQKMGQSTADITVDSTAGKFGPFAGQIFVGDQMNAAVYRVTLEKIGDIWQGACYPFRAGGDCGVNRIVFDAEGSMLIGETDRGWGSMGRKRYGIQRIKWTGKTPFEIHTMSAVPGGFELQFTQDIDTKSAADPASYAMTSYTYEYHQTYGSDEMETQRPTITGAAVVGPRTVRLTVAGLRSGGEGFVHELHAEGVRDATGAPLLHAAAYYTLQKAPG
ncbi:MAG: hypothetical protein IPJ41_11720 [Phycisphaerales bacterium]|nr:hypothetical protein [Phycisphaerales bacterium]